MSELAVSFDIHKSYNLLKQEQVVLSHFGKLDGDLVDMLIQLTDKKLAKSDTRIRVRKKVVNILVECLQNTLHYTTQFEGVNQDEMIVESPFLILSKQAGGYMIYTGNCMTSEKATFLKERIDEIKDLNAEELHSYYLQTLNKDALPDSGGAGLGLADILRRAKNNVSFEFYDLDNSYVLFCLLIQVESPQENVALTNEPKQNEVNEIKEI